MDKIKFNPEALNFSIPKDVSHEKGVLMIHDVNFRNYLLRICSTRLVHPDGRISWDYTTNRYAVSLGLRHRFW